MAELSEREKTKLLKILARIEKRKLVKLMERRTSFSFPEWFYELMDRNRKPMGMTRKAFIIHCVKKVTAPYEKNRAQKWKRVREMGYEVPGEYQEALDPDEVMEALEEES